MNKRQPDLIINRRRFLQRLVIASITVTGGYLLYEYAPWLNYARRAKEIWKPLKQESAMSVKMHELIRMATLPASGHNAQPWQFAVKDNAIEIHPDYRRRLPIVDPHDSEALP